MAQGDLHDHDRLASIRALVRAAHAWFSGSAAREADACGNPACEPVMEHKPRQRTSGGTAWPMSPP